MCGAGSGSVEHRLRRILVPGLLVLPMTLRSFCGPSCSLLCSFSCQFLWRLFCFSATNQSQLVFLFIEIKKKSRIKLINCITSRLLSYIQIQNMKQY